MTDAAWKKLIEAATVCLPDLGGQGVLVPGGFLLTATHCIEWSGTGGMALGGVHPATVVTPDGAKFRLGVAACDPVADIAVLGELVNPDYGDDCDAEYGEDCDAFEQWRERVAPVLLSNLTLGLAQSASVYILSHERKWMRGTVTRGGVPWQPPGHRIALRPDDSIKPGTSGGPVVTEDGRLLGVVSSSGAANLIPIAHLALPKWVLDGMSWTYDPDDISEEFRAKLKEADATKARLIRSLGHPAEVRGRGQGIPEVKPPKKGKPTRKVPRSARKK